MQCSNHAMLCANAIDWTDVNFDNLHVSMDERAHTRELHEYVHPF